MPEMGNFGPVAQNRLKNKKMNISAPKKIPAPILAVSVVVKTDVRPTSSKKSHSAPRSTSEKQTGTRTNTRTKRIMTRFFFDIVLPLVIHYFFSLPHFFFDPLDMSAAQGLYLATQFDITA